MIKVDTICGDDNSEDNSIIPFKTLTHAVDISKSGDTIMLQPGTYEDFQLNSKQNIFELTLSGSGYSSICVSSIFNGFFDVSYNDIKVDSFKIIAASSKFRFKNVRFVTLNVMELNMFDKKIGDNSKVYITFDSCRFDHNFQIIIDGGDYVITFKSCEISGKIPLIYAKKGDIVIKISNTDFEYTLLHVGRATAEIQHVSCNFPPDIPIFSGRECLIKSRDSVYSQTPIPITNTGFFGRTRSESNLFDGKEKGSDSISESDAYHRELYGAISINSDDCDELPAHKYTKIIHVKGTNSITIILPENSDNGHSIIIVSEGSKIIIDGIIYSDSVIIMGWIYDYGWLKIK
jgi:hypothetical protein